MAKETHLGLWIGASQAGLIPFTRGEIESLFGEIIRSALIDRISRINCALASGGVEDHGFRAWLTRNLLTKEWIENINRFLAKNPSITFHVIFHPRQMRMAMKLALAHSPAVGGRTLEDNYIRFRFGHALLSLHESYSSGPQIEPTPGTALYRLHLAMLMQHAGAFQGHDFAAKNALQNHVMEELFKDESLVKEFKQAIGCSPMDYHKTLFLLLFVSGFAGRGREEGWC